MSHTNGPWRVVTQKHKTGRLDIGVCDLKTEKYWIARMSNHPDISFEQEMADAKLLAAAPELLEFMLELKHLSRKELIELPTTMIEMLDNLIAKARGNT